MKKKKTQVDLGKQGFRVREIEKYYKSRNKLGGGECLLYLRLAQVTEEVVWAPIYMGSWTLTRLVKLVNGDS